MIRSLESDVTISPNNSVLTLKRPGNIYDSTSAPASIKLDVRPMAALLSDFAFNLKTTNANIAVFMIPA